MSGKNKCGLLTCRNFRSKVGYLSPIWKIKAIYTPVAVFRKAVWRRAADLEQAEGLRVADDRKGRRDLHNIHQYETRLSIKSRS